MAYRDYLREKWSKLKHDMEGVLNIENESGEISEDLLCRVRGNIIDNCEAIINEVEWK